MVASPSRPFTKGQQHHNTAPASWSSGPCPSLVLSPAGPTFCHLPGPWGCAKGLEAVVSTPSQTAQSECFLGGASHCSAFHQQCPFYPTTGAFVFDAEHDGSKFSLFQDWVYPASHPCFLFQGSSSLIILLRRLAVLPSATGCGQPSARLSWLGHLPCLGFRGLSLVLVWLSVVLKPPDEFLMNFPSASRVRMGCNWPPLLWALQDQMLR